MSKTAVAALGLILLVLFGAIAIPVVVEGSNSDVTQSETVNEGETTRIGFNLALRVNNVETDTVDVTLISRNTGNTTTETLNVSDPVLNQQNVTLENETIQLEVTRIENGNASISIVYPGTFGYSEGVLTIRDNLPIILVSMLFISIMAFVGRIR
jgi:hypothetical protein